MRVSIVGGGRWARTIASVLHGLADRRDRITLHSPSNFAGLQAWADASPFASRLRVARSWPEISAEGQPEAVIVANRVEGHLKAAKAALEGGIPVLVEKPVALSDEDIGELCRIAEAKGTFVGASHVLLFARYLEAYASAIPGEGHTLRFVWTDGVAERVRGEAKSFDAGVTVFDDVLPHILPVIDHLGFGDGRLSSIDLQRGGASVAIELRSGGRPVSVLVARNDEGRRRSIEIAARDAGAMLDFSTEPGTIQTGDRRCNGDPSWDEAPRPLATMLGAFLAAVEGAPLDARLSPGLAMATAEVASAVRKSYLAHQSAWLEQRLREPLEADLLYALTELSPDGERDVAAVTRTWSAIADRAGLDAFLSRSPLWLANQA